jgi:hypothetical protein
MTIRVKNLEGLSLAEMKEFGDQSTRRLVSRGGRGRLRVHGAGAERAALRSAEQRTKGNREEMDRSFRLLKLFQG